VPGRSIRITRIAGIPVGISPWWLLIVGLITWSLGASYFPGAVPGIAPVAAYGLGLACALLLFASILAHEFGHALVARRRGIEVEEIDLWLLGGVARMSGRPHTAEDELSFALAGPAVTGVIALAFGVAAIALTGTGPTALKAVVDYQWEVNLLILGFNLLPAFPLDGGRVARALLWRRSGDIGRATDIAAAIGRGFGYLIIAGAVLLVLAGYVGALWLAMIGMFVIAAARAERLQEQVVELFHGMPVTELMSRPVVSVPVGVTLTDAQHKFTQFHFTAFPVVDEAQHVLGLLTIEQLEKTPRTERYATLVSTRTDRDPGLLVDEHDDIEHLLERAAFQRVGRAAVVDRSGRAVGIVSVTDLERMVTATVR
jgi:Zn-dependent protease/predicted transcriptional regulator